MASLAMASSVQRSTTWPSRMDSIASLVIFFPGWCDVSMSRASVSVSSRYRDRTSRVTCTAPNRHLRTTGLHSTRQFRTLGTVFDDW
jgi:hypothetical protein